MSIWTAIWLSTAVNQVDAWRSTQKHGHQLVPLAAAWSAPEKAQVAVCSIEEGAVHGRIWVIDSCGYGHLGSCLTLCLAPSLWQWWSLPLTVALPAHARIEKSCTRTSGHLKQSSLMRSKCSTQRQAAHCSRMALPKRYSPEGDEGHEARRCR